MNTGKLEQLAMKLRASEQERRALRRAARTVAGGKLVPKYSGNRYIAEAALLREPIPDGHGAEWWITYTGMREAALNLRESPISALIESTLDPDALNGYVAFPKRAAPKLPAGTRDILSFIPVHGGVTYACKDSYMAVWGFDTMHYRSEQVPRTERAWILAQCRLLYTGLLVAAEFYPKWSRAGQDERCKMADWLLQLVDDERVGTLDRLNVTSMLSLLTGRIGD